MTLDVYKREALLHNKECIDAYSKNLGIVFAEIKPGMAKAVMQLKKEVVNPIGSIHGGALFSLADIVAGVAVNANGVNVTTLDSNIQYLAPAFLDRTKTLTAKATTKKAGKTIHVMEVDITDDNNTLIASSSFTFFVMR